MDKAKEFPSQLSVILPTYNESQNILCLVEEIRQNLEPLKIEYQIIIVDDNSPDRTGLMAQEKLANDQQVRVFIRREERGLASAILFGLQNSKSDLVAVMDTDFNHDPKELPKMLAKINDYDLIIGSRFTTGGGMENKTRYFLSNIFNRFMQFILKSSIKDSLSGYFLMRRKFLEELTYSYKIFSGYGDYFIRLLYYAQLGRLRLMEIPVFYKNRIAGQSKSKFLNMFIQYLQTAFQLKKQTKGGKR